MRVTWIHTPSGERVVANPESRAGKQLDAHKQWERVKAGDGKTTAATGAAARAPKSAESGSKAATE